MPDSNAATVASSQPAHPRPAAIVAQRPRPPSRPLTIQADETELTRANVLASVVSDPPLKILSSSRGPGLSTADVTIESGGAKQPAALRLFTERVHILAGPNVPSVQALAGRVVSFGPNKGPSEMIGRRLFQAMGVVVKETPLEWANAFDGAATGDVDAVVILAPLGFDKIKALKDSGLHLLPLPEALSPTTGLTVSTVRPSDYPGLVEGTLPIRIATVDADLKFNAAAARKPAAKTLVAALRTHAASLAARGFDLIGSGRLRMARSVAIDK